MCYIKLQKKKLDRNLAKFHTDRTRRHKMYKSADITQERVTTFDSEMEVAELELGNSRLGLGVIMIMAAFVGIWGVVCLIGGLASAGSFSDVWRGLVTAFSVM